MVKIIGFNVLNDYCLDIAFDNGFRGIVDLSDLAGKGIFSSWRDHNFFKDIKIGAFGELMWGDEIDLCPDSLYLKATGKKPEDVFNTLKGGTAYNA